MSAHAKADNWKACLEAGINDYILKPISRNVLFTALKNQIGPGHKIAVPESVLRSRQTSNGSDADMQALPGLDVSDGVERLGGRWLFMQKFYPIFVRHMPDFSRR